MEFSFDRGQKSPKSNTTTQTASDPFADARSQHLKNASTPNPQFQTQAQSSSMGGDSSEDRLRKAIERNRAKQEMRGGQEVKPQPQPQPQMQQAPRPAPTPNQAQTGGWSPGQVFNQQASRPQEAKPQMQQAPKPTPTPNQAEAGGWSPGQVFNKSEASVQSQPGLFQQEDSRSVNANESRARPEVVRPDILNREAQKPLSERLADAQKESFARSTNGATATTGARVNARNLNASQEAPSVDILEKKIPTSRAVVSRERRVSVEEEFTTPVKKVPKKITTPTYATKKNGALDPKWQNYLVKGCWAFCALMLLRLFFSQGGIVDYYDQSKILGDKKLELEQIKSENLALTKEISRMMNDIGYQKKIVRDNLGFIAQDEFLILFPKE